jgi:hypothetical protein
MSPDTSDKAQMPKPSGRGMGGGMWPMWICCVVMVLVLIVWELWR